MEITSFLHLAARCIMIAGIILLIIGCVYFIWYFIQKKRKKDVYSKKKQLKIWLSAKTLYLSAHSRIEILQITTILLPLNEPWYVRNPRYAKIWYSTSVLNRWKIEYHK